MAPLFIILTIVTSSFAMETVLHPRRVLDVQRGQVVPFDLRDYIHTRECELRVAPTAGDYYGTLAPKRLPSNVAPIFTYSHFGGAERNATLRFYALCGNRGLSRLYIEVHIVDNVRPLSMIVPRPGGTAVLDRVPQVVNMTDCWVTVFRPPRHGALTFRRGTGADTSELSCTELKGAIVYRHFRGAHPSDRFVLRVHRRRPYATTRYLQVDVHVSGEANRPPQATAVGQRSHSKGHGSHISGHNLWGPGARVTDDSTPAGRLMFRLLGLAPADGQSGNSGDANSGALTIFSSFTGLPLSIGSTFYQEELLSGGIVVETAQGQQNGTVTFQVFDEDGAWIKIDYSVSVSDWKLYNAVSRSALTGLLINEGATRPLQGFASLSSFESPTWPVKSAEESSGIARLSVTIVNGPILGSLLVAGSHVSHFTIGDLIESRVVYQNTRPGHRDFLKLSVEGAGVFIYPIYVVQEDRRPPLLGTKFKEPLIVGASGRVLLAPISINDPDSHPDDITYNLVSSIYGKIYLRKLSGSSVDGDEEEVSEWSHKDVIEGRVVYRLTNRPPGGAIDTIVFLLHDQAQPPNVSPPQHLQIRILRDTEAPKLISNTVLHASANVPTQVNSLQAIDVWPATHLTYTPRPNDGGLFTTNDGSILHVFTQAMLDKGQVYFTPPSKGQNVISGLPSSGFLEVPFSISDGDGNILHDQVLKVLPINSSQYQSRPPDEVIGVLYVSEGGTAELSEETLAVDDEDLDDDSTDEDEFVLDEPPRWGRILVDETPATRFNMTSLLLGDVSYEHDGSETGRSKEFDRFTLVRINSFSSSPASNETGSSRRRVGVEVVIEPVDDSPPQVEVRRQLAVDEGGQTVITRDHLAVWDDDSDDKDITCDVTLPPANGRVRPMPFTYEQLLLGNVVYEQSEHQRLEPVEDTFVISCHDVNPLRKRSGRLTVAIHPLNDEPPIVDVLNITTNFAQLSKIVKIYDLDNADVELTVGILEPPKVGAIRTKLNNTTNFTVSQLADLYYEGAEQKDEFTIAVSDSRYFVSKKIFVKVQQTTDLVHENKGIEVGVLKETIITKHELLSKSDVDDPKRIVYTLKNPPMFGSILKKKKELELGDKFTQDEINSRTVSYRHTDSHSLMDVFVLDVTDGRQSSLNKNVFVTIRSNSSTLKAESRNLLVTAGNRAALDDKILSVTMKNKKAFKNTIIEIGVVSPPNDESHFELEGGSSDVRTFNYDDVKSGKLFYVDTSGRARSEIVQLEITDGRSTTFLSLTVIVVKESAKALTKSFKPAKLTLVKHSPIRHLSHKDLTAKIGPEILFTSLRNDEGEVPTSTAKDLVYKLIQPPKHGQIVNNNNVSVNTFTQDDVNSGLIAYVLTSSSPQLGDSFIIDATSQNFPPLKGIQMIVEWSSISFKTNLFVCDENDRDFTLEFVRTGSTNLRASAELKVDGGNATVEDYSLESAAVTFAEGQASAKLEMRLKNDLIYETLETLTLSLTNPSNGILIANPSTATVYIFDDEDEDILNSTTTFQGTSSSENWSESSPQKREEREDMRCSGVQGTGFRFSRSSFEVSEEEARADVEIIRNGDLKTPMSLVCFTESYSASIHDYQPRPKNSSSEIFFGAGEAMKNCSVVIRNDDIFEGKEEFTLRMKCVGGLTEQGSASSAKVIITDEEDEEQIKFENEHYFVKEPKNPGSKLILVIAVVREGDATLSRRVSITARDGTALNGSDFIAKPAVLDFEAKARTKHFELEILSDNNLEIREFFTLRLDVEVGKGKKHHETIVHISDTLDIGGLMFPRPPQVISLKNYNKIDALTQKHPLQGYPLICLSVCDSQHRLHSKFTEWCASYNLTTSYRWQLEDLNGDMKDVQDALFFAKTTLKTLDSVYFRGGYRVRCGAAPEVEKVPGKISFSTPVTISRRQGLCPPPKDNMIGAEPFMSHISYNDVNGTRGLKITVTMAHHDGLFPALSTRKLSSFKEILASYPMRALVHKCSNLVTPSERLTKNGFLIEEQNFTNDDFTEPHQLSTTLRGNDTVRVYHHLDLRSCMWHFEAVFSLGEALEVCGATVKTEADKDEASVLLELPLYLSYFTHSLLGWQRTDSSTSMRLKFTYKTSTISKGDIGAMMDEKVEGHLIATNMFIASNGSLIVYFTTKPKFAGFFLYEVPGLYLSRVVNSDKPEQTFTLTQLGNLTVEGNSVQQSWVFASDFASVDYSGRYEIWLVPCVSQLAGASCTPRSAIPHSLQVQFQQVVDPVLKRYSLDTEFRLRKRKRGAIADEEDEESNDISVFEPGDFVEGVIEMVPPQDHLTLDIRRCYICAGRDGHVPKFDPSNKEFGCLMDSPELHFTMKLIDRDDGASIQKAFYNQLFNATFSKVECSGRNVSGKAKNCDAFIFDITPLFNQPLTKIWYVHCTYSISVEQDKRKRRSLQPKPSSSLESNSIHNSSLSLNEQGHVEVKAGTNIHQIILRDHLHSATGFSSFFEEPDSFPVSSLLQPPIQQGEFGSVHFWYLFSSVMAMGFSLLVSCCVIVFVIRLRRQLDRKNSKYCYVSYNNCDSTETNH